MDYVDAETEVEHDVSLEENGFYVRESFHDGSKKCKEIVVSNLFRMNLTGFKTGLQSIRSGDQTAILK